MPSPENSAGLGDHRPDLFDQSEGMDKVLIDLGRGER
jgi:hypothetical protein